MKKSKVFILLLFVGLAICGLRLRVLYQESLLYENTTITQEYLNIDGVTISIQDPNCSQTRYRLTGNLLNYTISNDTKFNLAFSPATRIEYLLSDGNWSYYQPIARENKVTTASAIALALPANSVTNTFTVSTENIFTRWAKKTGTYRLAVDYYCENDGAEIESICHTVYAEFTIS